MAAEIIASLRINANDIARMSMLLAMSPNREMEKSLRQTMKQVEGLSFAVTEVAGTTDVIKQKLVSAIMGAAINEKVISRSAGESHAVLHAAIEAQKGIMLDTPAMGNMALKVAIVAEGGWVAVAIFGESAYSALTNHRRAGMGIMHLG